jgi:hypothetical protein
MGIINECSMNLQHLTVKDPLLDNVIPNDVREIGVGVTGRFF